MSQLLTVKQIAKLLVLSPRTIYRLAAEDRMPAPVRVGRSVRWDTKDIEAWLAAGCPRRRLTRAAK